MTEPNTNCTYTPGSPTHQIVRDIFQGLTVLFMMYTANVSSRSHDKIEKVEDKQKEVIVRQAEAAEKVVEVKEALETSKEDGYKTTAIQLYSTWVYLKDVAVITKNKQDIDKANEARKVYEKHLKKEDGGK